MVTGSSLDRPQRKCQQYDSRRVDTPKPEPVHEMFIASHTLSEDRRFLSPAPTRCMKTKIKQEIASVDLCFPAQFAHHTRGMKVLFFVSVSCSIPFSFLLSASIPSHSTSFSHPYEHHPSPPSHNPPKPTRVRKQQPWRFSNASVSATSTSSHSLFARTLTVPSSVFPGASRFKVNGISILFLQDENRRR